MNMPEYCITGLLYYKYCITNTGLQILYYKYWITNTGLQLLDYKYLITNTILQILNYWINGLLDNWITNANTNTKYYDINA